MTHDDVPRGLETAELSDELHSVDSGQKVTYPVSISNTLVRITTTDDDSIQVLGVKRSDRRNHADGDTYALTGIYKKYVVGENNDLKYLILEDVLSISPITDSEDEPDQGADTGEEGTGKEQKKTSTTSKRPTLSSGKRVTTSGGDERITGKNPFADPKRLKETGIHQGGI